MLVYTELSIQDYAKVLRISDTPDFEGLHME